MMNNDELLNAAELLVSSSSPQGALVAYDELTLQRGVSAATWRKCAAVLSAAAEHTATLGFPAETVRKYTDRAADCLASADWVDRTSGHVATAAHTLQWIPIVGGRS